MEDINKTIKELSDTIFDKEEFNFNIDLSNAGHAIRDDLARVYNAYGTLNGLVSRIDFLYEQAKIKRDKVEVLAWDSIFKDSEKSKLKSTTQKIIVINEVVKVEGKETTLLLEDDTVNQYRYFLNRGKDKLKELTALLDIGRSILSWDRAELERML